MKDPYTGARVVDKSNLVPAQEVREFKPLRIRPEMERALLRARELREFESKAWVKA